MPRVRRSIIVGAAGRDFHDFRTFFRENPDFHVCAFTAAQIPFIDERSFPRELAGPEYDADIPIHPESELAELIRRLGIEFVFLAYSDLSHREVMHKQSLVQACGASFVLLGPRHTQLVASRPVVSVTAVRTGAGKSPICQSLARQLVSRGRRPGVLRHPMPYGALKKQVALRFADLSDLDRHGCTIEEREEYRPYVEQRVPVYAGVDYVRILELAEADSDVLIWDGGNNDYPFLRPDLAIVVADALRPGHEVDYYPGETNFRSADVIVINKVGAAEPDAVEIVRRNAADRNPHALVVEGDLDVAVENSSVLEDRRVLVIEDGPTLTHGGMSAGAGALAARRSGAREMIDPRPFAVGSIAKAFAAHPHIGPVLPALGYSTSQREELKRTIRASGAEVVLDASPARVGDLLALSIPVLRVSYRFRQLSGRPLFELVEELIERQVPARGIE
jgi:predicted GTPase